MNEEQQNTTPLVDHKAVNQWMLANGWVWQVSDKRGFDGYWMKPNQDTVSQGLAAEMWRMAEARVEVAYDQGVNELAERIKMYDWQLEDSINANDTVCLQVDAEVEELLHHG